MLFLPRSWEGETKRSLRRWAAVQRKRQTRELRKGDAAEEMLSSVDSRSWIPNNSLPSFKQIPRLFLFFIKSWVGCIKIHELWGHLFSSSASAITLQSTSQLLSCRDTLAVLKGWPAWYSTVIWPSCPLKIRSRFAYFLFVISRGENAYFWSSSAFIPVTFCSYISEYTV